jgi:hypothetical protein
LKKTKEKIGKLKKKSNFEKQNLKKKGEKLGEKKREEKALWITVVIHSAFGCGETVISLHPLVICIMLRLFFKL